MKEYKRKGDDEKGKYYYLRQWSKKIISNSFYGVLLLETFRFYDKDNGEAITLTGQSVIKFTTKVANSVYNKELGTVGKDYCIYTDTDSVFYTSLPFIERDGIDPDNDDESIKKTLEVADLAQSTINAAYDEYARRLHNIDKHCFIIKQEVVARRALFVAKKRYTQWMVYEEGVSVNKMDVKGLDTVRSDFPQSFRTIVEKLFEMVLHDKEQDEVEKLIVDFKKKNVENELYSRMRPTGVKNITKYKFDNRDIFHFMKGTPVHVKAALSYNDFLEYKNVRGYKSITDGDKIVYAYLRDNPLKLSAIALPVDDVPKEVEDFVYNYIDDAQIFDSLLKDKIQKIFTARGWGQIILNNTIKQFFEL